MIAGFCILVKWLFYSSIRNKKVRNSVSEIQELFTHQNELSY
jgi:hypothetical protein